jgi:glycerol-3-phosphate acyltransferase PlsY
VTFPVALVVGILAIPAWTAANLYPLFVAAILIPLLVIIRHRENIGRLLSGTESKIRDKHPTV